MSLEDDFLFCARYRVLIDIRIQMIMPSFSALFACSATYPEIILKFLCNEGPPLGAILINQLDYGFIFCLIP